jgi:hypothetical protein
MSELVLETHGRILRSATERLVDGPWRLQSCHRAKWSQATVTMRCIDVLSRASRRCPRKFDSVFVPMPCVTRW